jgi:hypothetical protein
VREIRTLRAMWRALETEPRQFLTGHEEGNLGYKPRRSLRAAAPVLDPTGDLSGLGPIAVGDVRIMEPGGGVSDLIRFTNASGLLTGGQPGADRMIFYSEPPDPGESGVLADTGLPLIVERVPNDNGGVIEIGVEGNNRFQWSPFGQDNNVYIGVSDGAIPEPSTLSFFIFGSLSVLLAKRFIFRRATAAAQFSDT